MRIASNIINKYQSVFILKTFPEKKRNQNITTTVKEYWNRLFRFIRGRVPSTADAEDITQEVW